MHCECFIVLKSPVINNRYSDSLYSGTRSEGNGATGGVVVTSSCLERSCVSCFNKHELHYNYYYVKYNN